jgi:osmotically inducible protein OsmC
MPKTARDYVRKWPSPCSSPLSARAGLVGSALAQIEKVLYTAKVHTTGGREGGTSRTSDGRLAVKLTTPGAKGDGTNPEQLFAVDWSSCFLSAIKLAAAKTKVKLPADVAVDAEVDLGTTGVEYFRQARLNVSLPGIDRQTAQNLVDGALRRYPYSKAVRGNINVVTNLIDAGATYAA